MNSNGQIALPEIGPSGHSIRSASVRDGYRRGWGLQFGDLAEKIRTHPLYQRSFEASGKLSIVDERKRMNLFLILTNFLGALESQNIIEFGAYKGGNALFMAQVLKELYPGAVVYALDTFTGMPDTDTARDLHRAGDFNDSSYGDLIRYRDARGLTNLVPVQGRFDQTFPTLHGKRFGLAHIDCDIYSAVSYCQNAVWPQMAPGGYIVYDDADVSSCIGATEAVEDLVMERRLHSEQVWPHWVFRANAA